MRIAIALAMAMALFGCSEPAQEQTVSAQLQWEAKTDVDEFDDFVFVTAWLRKDADTHIEVACDVNGSYVEIHQSKSLQFYGSEEIEVRFDDEAIEAILVKISGNNFRLSTWNHEEDSSDDPVELARRQ